MSSLPAIVVALAVALLAAVTASAQSSLEAQRAELMEDLERHVRETMSYTGRARISTISVMKAMAAVARHKFVPSQMRDMAYGNRPLPIGEGQTIFQPYIVALMTDLTAVDRNSIVLEVGTGSGYQAAVLAEIVDHVYTIEIVEPLGRRAAETLERLGRKRYGQNRGRLSRLARVCPFRRDHRDGCS